MTRDAKTNLLDLACEEFVEALIGLPSLQRRNRITSTDIQAALNSVGWELDAKPSQRPLNDVVSVTDLLHICNESVRSRDTGDGSLSVVVLNSTSWKSTSTPSVNHSSKSTKMDPASDDLPDGLKEFVHQLKQTYERGAESTLEKTEAVEALRSSQHLSVVFDPILRHFINKIRKEYRTRDVCEYLDVINAIVTNPWYTVASSGEFNIVLSCLLTCIIDVNMHEPSDQVRTNASSILCAFLELKIGKFHSVQLVRDIFQNMLFPFLEKAINLESDQRTPGIRVAAVAALTAVVQLRSEFSTTNEQLGKLRSRLIASLNKEEKSSGVSDWSSTIRSQLDNLS